MILSRLAGKCLVRDQGLFIFRENHLCNFRRNVSLLLSAMSAVGEPEAKIKCVKIGTHNGSFHCDEVLACFMLKQLEEFKNAEIIRTRDPALLETCDVVVDVGGVFDPAKDRYDHHQRGFTETMHSLDASKPWVTKLSSAGLIYFHFGKELVSGILERPMNDPITTIIYDKVYENFMEEIDAIDNGVNQTDEKPRYRISTTLSSRVGRLNPRWNQANKDETVQFEKAMELVGAEFLDRVREYQEVWLPARDIVEEAIKGRHKVDPSGQIAVLSEGGTPWKEHLYSLEKEMKLDKDILFVLYTDQSSNWRVQCVSVDVGSFKNRLSLKEEWRGLRDEELSKLSGIDGCIFVHASGFIGGNKTFEGVLEMARQSLIHKDSSQEK